MRSRRFYYFHQQSHFLMVPEVPQTDEEYYITKSMDYSDVWDHPSPTKDREEFFLQRCFFAICGLWKSPEGPKPMSSAVISRVWCFCGIITSKLLDCTVTHWVTSPCVDGWGRCNTEFLARSCQASGFGRTPSVDSESFGLKRITKNSNYRKKKYHAQ